MLIHQGKQILGFLKHITNCHSFQNLDIDLIFTSASASCNFFISVDLYNSAQDSCHEVNYLAIFR
jgi:hypothetical protein